jgi:dolichyl-phosphate beta-glucosyltransferase
MPGQAPSVTVQVRTHLSVIIPAYNEERRIAASLQRLTEYLPTLEGRYEILVVDDGSTDGTGTIVEQFTASRPSGDPRVPAIELLNNGRNRGKGFSLKHGVLMAKGEHLLLSDADFSTPIEELPRLLRPVTGGECEIAIGSRGLPDSRVEIHQPAWREMMGRFFNRLVRGITGLPFRDTQCGFKVMRRAAVVSLFRAARVERFAYDVEILYLARKSGIRILEVPVIWRDAPGTKVHALFDSIDMMKDIVKIVWRDRRGRYATPSQEGRAR